MKITRKVYRFLFVALFLQTLAVGNPARAGEQQAPDRAYFDLILATCHTCHSANGTGVNAIPSLEGLSEARIKELLVTYKTDKEQVTIMNRISKALTDTEIDRISAMLGQEER